MAWLERRTDSTGRIRFYAVWRDTKTRARRSRPLGPVPEDAARAAVEKVAADEEGREPKPSSLSHRQALGKFKDHLRFLRRAPRTIEFYGDILGPLFDDLAEKAEMRRWRRGHLHDALAARPEWSPRTVQMAVSACRRFVRWARKARVTCPDFVEDLKGPAVAVREVTAYTPTEAARIIAAARGTVVETAVALALLAGLSFADLRALRWEDVTFERDRRGVATTAWIRRKRTKTSQPIEVALSGPIVAQLDERAEKTGLVCDELPADDSGARRSLRAVLRRAGVANGGWHRLRHSFGSLLASSGADLATIRRMMGHAPGSTMTLRYMHSDSARIGKAAVAVERLLAAKPAKRSASAAG